LAGQAISSAPTRGVHFKQNSGELMALGSGMTVVGVTAIVRLLALGL